MMYGKVLGAGRTATVHEWKDGKVIKLFYLGYSKEAAQVSRAIIADYLPVISARR